MTTTSGSPDIYALDPIGNPVYVEREGRKFKAAGIGTSDMIYSFYHEIDDSGNVIGEHARPMEWWFPDPAKVAVEQTRQDRERQRLALAATFPIEGMSGEWDDGLTVWRTDGDESEYAYIGTGHCHFCKTEAACVYASSSYDDSVPVCRECLNKIFDVFEQHESGGE